MVFEMPDLASAAFWAALGKIIIANIILSGDNAVVIAMACRNLSAKHRNPAIIGGSLGAIVLRIIFVFMITWLLSVPYLKLIGGALLLWIGVKLLNEEEGGGEGGVKASASLWGAIWTIVVADAIMSLDNAIAIAAAAHGDVRLVMIGLLLSMPLVIFGAGLLIRLLNRFPILVVAGASLLGYIAGDLIVSDRWMIAWLGGADTPVAIGCPLAVAAALAVTGLALRWSTLQSAFVPSRGDAL